ncbi:hypothetical protein QZH41_006066, partial [Actinostola sp. cb2023]
MARRGRPSHIWSDNGTNFVGAEKELRDGLKRLDKERIYDQLSQDGIQWHFNPPSSPHFGGIWERLVQSAKRALRVVAGKQCVTDETLLTFMAEVESLLNGRPLTHVSSDYRVVRPLPGDDGRVRAAEVRTSAGTYVRPVAKLCILEEGRESLLVCVDACSRWPEVEILRSTTSEVIVSHLRKIFAVHGLPEQVTSDNGSNLVSATMEQYLEANGIKHRKVTPYWPQANAQVERFNRTVEKAIHTAHVEGKNWRMELYIFLLNYRATPHATTGVSPAKILFGREIRTKVPQLPSKETPEALRAALQFDKERKQHMKEYADKKRGLTTIQEGDQVLLKLERDNKLTPAFDPDPYTVIERKGASVVLQREEGYTLMRNVSAVKKVYIQENLTESELDFDGLNQAADPEPVPAQDDSYLLSSETASTASSDEGNVQGRQRARLNAFLEESGIEPISRHWVPWSQAVDRTRQRYVERSAVVIAAVMKAIYSNDACYLWSELKKSTAVDQFLGDERPAPDNSYLEALAEAYKNA